MIRQGSEAWHYQFVQFSFLFAVVVFVGKQIISDS